MEGWQADWTSRYGSPMAETEDGFISAHIWTTEDPYVFLNGSGIRVARVVTMDGEATGDFMFQIRLGSETVTARITPADVGALHQQALKGSVIHVHDTGKENLVS